jgi:hypothetical protein
MGAWVLGLAAAAGRGVLDGASGRGRVSVVRDQERGGLPVAG